MQIMAKCSSRSKSMMVLVCSLAMFGMQNNFDLCLQHITRVDNGIADALSRFNNNQFWHLVLDMDPSMTLLVCFPYQLAGPPGGHYTSAQSSAQTFHFSAQVPSLCSWPLPTKYLHRHHLYRLSIHFQVLGHLL